MSIATASPSDARQHHRPIAAIRARRCLAAVLAIGTVAGLAATAPHDTASAVARAGAELTHLLRFMALLKVSMAAAALAGVWWRLRTEASPAWLIAYCGAAAAVASGPGLIWHMAHVGLGAVLLHGGLLGTLVLLWRDPAVTARLTAAWEARRGTMAGHDRRGGHVPPGYDRPGRSTPGAEASGTAVRPLEGGETF